MDTSHNFTPQELAAMREMGYSKEDIEKLYKDRNNWHKVKKESFDERIVEVKEDIEDELNFEEGC